MPAKIATKRYAPVRGGKTAPHVPLRILRQVANLTLEQVADRITAAFPEMNVSRGTLSAIESGSRGVSDLMLRALERAFDIPEGSMTTEYTPRTRTNGDAE